MVTLTRDQAITLIKIANGVYNREITVEEYDLLFDIPTVFLWLFQNPPCRILTDEGKAALEQYLCDNPSQTEERTDRCP